MITDASELREAAAQEEGKALAAHLQLSMSSDRDGPIVQNTGARFVSTASSTAKFNAWLAGDYTSVFVNIDAAVSINGQLLNPASVSSGMASALSQLSSPFVNGSPTDLKTARKVRPLTIPMASPVSSD